MSASYRLFSLITSRSLATSFALPTDDGHLSRELYLYLGFIYTSCTTVALGIYR